MVSASNIESIESLCFGIDIVFAPSIGQALIIILDLSVKFTLKLTTRLICEAGRYDTSQLYLCCRFYVCRDVLVCRDMAVSEPLFPFLYLLLYYTCYLLFLFFVIFI